MFNEVKIKPKANLASLSDNISQALHRNWFMDSKAVKVSSEGGSVKLSGSVHSWHDRNVAGTTAWSAPGVMSVDNQLTVS